MNIHTGDNTDTKSALDFKQLQLHWLLQITKAINYNLPSGNLFDIYCTVLKEQLKIKKLVLLVNEDGWKIPVIYGTETPPPFSNPATFAFEMKKLSEQHKHSIPWMDEFDTIIPVMHQDIPLAYALVGDVDENIYHSKREIVTYIHTITNLVVVAIENKRLTRESIRQAAMEREMELAAQMQAMLFPQSLVSHTTFDIAATYIPHHSVGGDYYDFIPLNEEEALVCMADVSGKGISAALLMSNFQANLHAIIRHTGFTLQQVVTELNNCVNRSAQGEKYITFFIAKINNRTNQIEYINAGHNPPMLIHENEIRILDRGTTGLGMFEELPFLNAGTSEFNPGSLLFCYTDGITEMENRQGVVFGTDHLGGLLIRHREIQPMNRLHEIMVESFDTFRKEVGFSDDVTFLSLRLKK